MTSNCKHKSGAHKRKVKSEKEMKILQCSQSITKFLKNQSEKEVDTDEDRHDKTEIQIDLDLIMIILILPPNCPSVIIMICK